MIPLQRLSTGDPALDLVLGGGLPTHSTTVVAGEPGAGKTVFALQVLFHLARQGRRTLYFTTLSEPALKLMRYVQLFDFFDPALLDEQITFVDLGTAIRGQGVERMLAEINARVERAEPDLVAIDSFKAIHDLLGGPSTSRAFVYDLAVHMAGWGATTLLIGEYSAGEIATEAEFAIADGIIRLSNQRQELTTLRQFEVLKLRGANYVSGQHFFEITPAGIRFYPRVRAPEVHDSPAISHAERASTGITGLDELLRGGLPRASSTIVEGGTGTGKTLLGLHFLLEGTRLGEPSLLLTLEETPQQLRDITANYGWDLADLEARGLFRMHYTSPVELSTDRFLDDARQQIERLGARRVVLDSLTSAALGVPSERRFRELVYALTKHMRVQGVSLLMTMEVAELLGTAQLTGHGVSSIADNVILIRYVEVEAHLERAISVLKARGVAHSSELRRLEIGAQGMEVSGRYSSLRAVLTGVPVPTREPAG